MTSGDDEPAAGPVGPVPARLRPGRRPPAEQAEGQDHDDGDDDGHAEAEQQPPQLGHGLRDRALGIERPTLALGGHHPATRAKWTSQPAANLPAALYKVAAPG